MIPCVGSGQIAQLRRRVGIGTVVPVVTGSRRGRIAALHSPQCAARLMGGRVPCAGGRMTRSYWPAGHLRSGRLRDRRAARPAGPRTGRPAGKVLVVDRSTTRRNSALSVDDWADRSARQRLARVPEEGVYDLAKVRVAGSNPVVRSKKLLVRVLPCRGGAPPRPSSEAMPCGWRRPAGCRERLCRSCPAGTTRASPLRRRHPTPARLEVDAEGWRSRLAHLMPGRCWPARRPASGRRSPVSAGHRRGRWPIYP